MSDKIQKSIFSGLFWKFSERILAQAVSFIVSVILSRLLLPSDYGTVAIVLIFINIANVFVTSGFSTALVQNKDATEVDFSTNFYCSLCMSFIVYALMYCIAPFIASFYSASELTLIIRVFSLRIPISAFSAIQHAYVERNMLFKRYFFSTLFGTLISGVVGIILAYFGAGVWALIAQYFTNTIIDIVVLLCTVPWKPKLQFSVSSAKKMMNYGWKILAADLSGTFFDQLRSLIVGKVYTSADLAFYNKGNQLPNLITTNISASIMTVLFPAIANIHGDPAHVKSMTRKSVKMMSYVMFPMLFGLACVSKPLVDLLFTEKWELAVPYVQILSAASAFSLIGSVSLQSIKAVGRSDVVLKLEVYKKPVYTLLLIIGVCISPLAVAITMLIYSIYANIVNGKQLSIITGYNRAEQIYDLLPALVMSALMSIVIYPLNFIHVANLWIIVLQVIVGFGVYVLLSIISHNESYATVHSLIREQLNGKRKNNRRDKNLL